MNRPEPPPGIHALPAIELEDLADATAALIRQARRDGLVIPSSVNLQGYGTPSASLYVSESDTPDIWAALQEWATRYRTGLRHRPGSDPAATHAAIEFMNSDGIRYEIHSVIHAPAPDPWETDDDWPDDPNPAA